MVFGLALTIAAAKTPEYSVGPVMLNPMLQRQELFRQRLHRR